MKTRKIIAAALGLAALAVFPVFSGNPYYIHLVETIMIYAILLFGLDIVVGYTGQVSLGHAGLFGVGAYTAGVLFIKLGMPFYVTAPLAILVTAGFGAILALPALRVSGPYLAMVTLAFGTIIQILINEMDFLTNGPMGIKIPKPADRRSPDRMRSSIYWLVAVLLVVSLVVVHRVLQVASRPRVRGLARQPDRLRLHGRLGVSIQGLRVRDQRGLRRTGRLPLFVFRAVHLAEHVQLRADDPVPARDHHGRPQDAHRRRCSARRSS